MTDGKAYRRDVLKAGGAAAALGVGGSGFLQTLVESEEDQPSTSGFESFVGQNDVVQTVCSPNCRGHSS